LAYLGVLAWGAGCCTVIFSRQCPMLKYMLNDMLKYMLNDMLKYMLNDTFK
jgi:hypothetical protein